MMNTRKVFWLGIVAAAALAATGCSDDGNNNTGGSGGEGGTGGMPMGTANVTAVHLAPEVPSAESTAVALFVNGEEQTALGTLSYSQSTGKIALPAGEHDIGVGLPGSDGPLIQHSTTVARRQDLTVVAIAYRANVESDAQVRLHRALVNSTADLAPARVAYWSVTAAKRLGLRSRRRHRSAKSRTAPR